jgi:sporulation protein YlmC with PRC-barrel domain
MLLQFGADVRDPEGGKRGSLRRTILDDEAEAVIEVTAEHSAFDEREVIIPMEYVLDADDVTVTVDLTEDEFNKLEDYATERNVAPPPAAAEVTSDIVKDPDVPDVPPVGAATGVESIAFTPLLEEAVHVPPGDVALDSNTRIYANDGELGHLKAVNIDDDTLQIQFLAVESGFVFLKDTDVPLDLVEDIRAETIVLRVSKASLGEKAGG